MIVLTVQRYNGAPCDPLVASFDELGGSIGRAPTNHMVLPDPERTVSRVHAEVVWRNGVHAVIDRGSNAVLVNGQPLGNGREHRLGDGDELQVGGYTLLASVGHAATSADPFADLFEPARVPATAAARAPAPPVQRPAPAAAPAPSPFAAAAGSPPGRKPSAAGIPDDWDPFAPDAAPAGAPLMDAGLLAASPLGLPVSAPARETSLDDLFGLSPGPAHGADPFGATPAALRPVGNTAADADPLRGLLNPAAPTAAPRADHASELSLPWDAAPLQAERGGAGAASSVPAPVAATRGAGGIDIGDWMNDDPAPARASAPARPPAGPVYSWEQPSRDGRMVTPETAGAGTLAGATGDAPGAAQPAPSTPAVPATVAPAASGAEPDLLPDAPGVAGAAAASDVGADADADTSPLTIVVARSAPPPPRPQQHAAKASAAPSPAASPSPVRAPSAGSAAAPAPAPVIDADAAMLLRALFDGLGLAAPPAGAASGAAQMRLVGQLLREATRGAVELLLARAALKREMRADVTVIVARENNPLKFSPTVEAALGHLLGAPTPGFMAPADAMRDAFDDLRAHQLGVMAGMRAALEGVVARFDPALLEGHLVHRSGMGSLLLSGRKARLWESFQALYSQLSQEATDDFQQLFGKAFREAYEAHIDRLRQDGGA